MTCSARRSASAIASVRFRKAYSTHGGPKARRRAEVVRLRVDTLAASSAAITSGGRVETDRRQLDARAAVGPRVRRRSSSRTPRCGGASNPAADDLAVQRSPFRIAHRDRYSHTRAVGTAAEPLNAGTSTVSVMRCRVFIGLPSSDDVVSIASQSRAAIPPSTWRISR